MTHPQLVQALCKPGQDILESLYPHQAHQLHMMIGLAGEVGELLDCLKKTIIYGKPLDMVNCEEELGDIEFYLEGIRESLNISRDVCLQNNIAKLTKRYGERYSNAAAQQRKDKEWNALPAKTTIMVTVNAKLW